MLIIITIVLVVLVFKARVVYATWINPISAFFLWEYLLFTFIPVLSDEYISSFSADGYKIFKEIQYIFILGGILGFLVPSKKFFFMIFSLSTSLVVSGKNVSKGVIWFFYIITVLSLFLVLAKVGGGGTLWITDTRAAYMSHRSGAGIFWLLIQWLSITLQAIILLRYKPSSIWQICLLLIPFLIVGFYTGSKHNLSTPIILSVIYYEYYIRRVSAFKILVIIFMLAALFSVALVMQSRQGNFSWLEAAYYFAEYSVTSTRYLSDEFLPLGFGQYSLSSLWYYVPRGLYPEKPFEYGVLHIHKELFPGAAAKGNTPGISPWMLMYLDFGRFGVFLYGFYLTSFAMFVYAMFRKHRDSSFIFLFMVHICIFQMYALWPSLGTLLALLMIFNMKYGRKTT